MTAEENKRKGISRLVLLCGRFAGIIGILLVLFYSINTFLLKKFKYQLNEETQTLICGPSVLKCSLDPKIIPYSENISQEGELHTVSRIKLDFILSQEHKPNNLILYFSPSVFLNKLNLLTENPLLHKEMIRRLFPIADTEDFRLCHFPDKTIYQNRFQQHFLPNEYWKFVTKKKIKPSDYPYIGSFRRHYRSKVDKTKASILKNITPQNKWESTFNQKFIDDLNYIIQQAQEKEINVILANIPEHREIKALNTAYIDSQFVALEQELRQNEELYFFDISAMDLPDSMFLNISHLNSYGAEICSDSLKIWMQERDLIKEMWEDAH